MRGYLNNSSASVLFRRVKSTDLANFEPGTPQGEVFRPALFNVLIYK